MATLCSRVLRREDWGLAVEHQRSPCPVTPAMAREPPPHILTPPDDEEEEEDEDKQGLSKAEISLMQKILRTQLLESSQEVEVKSGSPLHSVKSFRQLNIPEQLLKGVFAMGFDAPSRIQETALPTLMADPPVNMIAQAQSGTGKTAAFVLAALFRVQPQQRHPQVLILAPTYELAVQIADVTRQMASFCEGVGVRMAVREERLPKGHRIEEQVVIGTPGKVFDWAMRHRHFDLHLISLFVLDEADIMISIQGHQDQCLRIHKKLSERPHPLPDAQMLLFSATYTPEVMDFAEMIIAEPIVIRLKREEESLHNVKQFRVLCSGVERKYAALANIYGVLSLGQVIVFCRTKKTAAWLGAKMTQDGHSVGYLSSDLTTEQRLAVLTRFRKGQEKVLITTNVCARGIDIEQVTMVVNFDLPTLHVGGGGADCETYLHRIGRTGRFGKAGVALNMAADERDLRVLHEIEEHFGRRIQPLDADDVDALESLK